MEQLLQSIQFGEVSQPRREQLEKLDQRKAQDEELDYLELSLEGLRNREVDCRPDQGVLWGPGNIEHSS